jgi:hypothetical protein
MLILIITAVLACTAAAYTALLIGYAHGRAHTETDLGQQIDAAWDAAERAVNELDATRRDIRVGFIAVPSWDHAPIQGAILSSAEAEAFIAALHDRADTVIAQLAETASE